MTNARIDKHQAIRLQRLGMAAVSYGLQAAVVGTVALFGAIDWRIAAGYVCLWGVIVVGFYAVFRSGMNLRFSDPNLTFIQVLVPLAPAMSLLYQVDGLTARTGILLTVGVPLLYGILGLSLRRFLLSALLYLLGYLLLFGAIAIRDPAVLGAPDEWLVLIMFTALLAQVSLIGSFISGLRGAL